MIIQLSPTVILLFRQYTVDVVCRRLGYSEYGDPTKVQSVTQALLPKYYILHSLSLAFSSPAFDFNVYPALYQVVQLLEEPLKCDLAQGQVRNTHEPLTGTSVFSPFRIKLS